MPTDHGAVSMGAVDVAEVEEVIVTAAPPFDPATLALTGWWRDFSGAPWAGTASAGASGGRSLIGFGSDPSVGTPVNGHTPADCSGAGKGLQDLTENWSDFITASAYTILALVWLDTAGATTGVPYADASILADTNGGAYIGLGYSASGVQVYHLNVGTYDGPVAACSTGAWHLVVGRYDGTDMTLQVDSGVPVTLARGNISTGFNADHINVALNFGGIGTLDGKLLELAMSQTHLSDADVANFKSYVNARYGLSL